MHSMGLWQVMPESKEATKDLTGYVRSKYKQTGANISKNPIGKVWEHIKNSDCC